MQYTDSVVGGKSANRAPSTTIASSAEVIPFGKAHNGNGRAKPTFQQARDAWLQRWQAEGLLTHADRALVIQLHQHFNQLHFNNSGGELLAWPSWETIAARARLSEASIFRGFRKLERLGALEVIHGGRDPKTGWKLPNKYLTIPPPPFRMNGDHPSNRKEATFHGESRLVESDSLKEDSLKKEDIDKERFGLPSGPQSGPKEKKESEASKEGKPSEDLSSSDSSSLPALYPPPPSSARPPSPTWVVERPLDYDPVQAMRERLAARRNGGMS
jgi:hypothetical protein